MNLEIERKFLVRGGKWKTLALPTLYSQGYLSTDKRRTVRVRSSGDQAWLTIKGVSVGISRPEFEYSIPAEDAKQLLELCDQPLIVKQRYRIPFGGLVWEVDEFAGENLGLVVAEVELSSEDQAVQIPEWVGDEVTHDPRYTNSALSRHPFSQWS